MPRRTPKYAREQMTKTYLINREEERCLLIRKLFKQFRASVEELETKKANLYQQAEAHDRTAKECRDRAAQVAGQISTLQNNAGLSHTERKTAPGGNCRLEYMHPEIRAFDKKTDETVLRILTEDVIDPAELGIIGGQ